MPDKHPFSNHIASCQVVASAFPAKRRRTWSLPDSGLPAVPAELVTEEAQAKMKPRGTAAPGPSAQEASALSLKVWQGRQRTALPSRLQARAKTAQSK